MQHEIVVDDPNMWLVPRVKVDGDWIAHVRCEGAHFHVLHWSTLGTHCSEKMCIINKPREIEDGNVG